MSSRPAKQRPVKAKPRLQLDLDQLPETNSSRTHRPNLSREAVGRIAERAVDVPEAELPAYGDRLLQTIASTAPWRSWLEAAVLAGHVPHLEGLVLAFRALQELTLAEISEYTQADADGDALAATELADAYREVIVEIEELATELDRLALEMLATIPVYPSFDRAESKRRRRNIAHSETRLELLREDGGAYEASQRKVYAPNAEEGAS